MKNTMKNSLSVAFCLAFILFLAMGAPHAADTKEMKDSGVMMKEGQTMVDNGEKMMREGKVMVDKGEMMVKEGKAMMDKGKMMKSEGQMKLDADRGKGMK